MINREEQRLRKLHERDDRVRQLHETYPALQAMDAARAQIVLKMVRLALRKDAEEKRLALQKEMSDLEEEQAAYLAELGLDESVYEPSWDCALCEDKGYTGPRTPCPCVQKERREAMVERSGMPDKLRSMRFENFRTDLYNDPEDMAQKVARCRDFVAHIIAGDPVGNLVLRGDVGRGKTHLSAAIANALIDAGKEVIYCRTDTLLDWIRTLKFYTEDLHERDRDLWRFYNSDLLIIDDLGSESVSEFSLNQLQRLIEERNLRNKPWVINTNLSTTLLEERYDARFSDRVFEKASIFRMESPKSIRLLRLDDDITLV